MISRFISRLRRQVNEIRVDTRHPESYWILRGKNVIGQAGPEELRKGRQVETYYAIFNAIENRSLTQVVDLGCNVAALAGGRLDFGTWERIFYGEFDGRRRKRVLVKIIGE